MPTIAKDAQGNNKTIVTRFRYDRRGRKSGMDDPDMGTWSYYYNAAGEMTLQVDAKGQTTVSTYDGLGRMVNRKTADEDTTWTYHPATAGDSDRGRLQMVSSSMTDADGGVDAYDKTFVYNEYGQPVSVTERLPGIDSTAPLNVYQTQRSYDDYGRLLTLTYPQATPDLVPVSIQYNYNAALGHLDFVNNQQTGVKHWEFIGAEADGNLSKENLGGVISRTHEYDVLRMPTSTYSSSTAGGGLRKTWVTSLTVSVT